LNYIVTLKSGLEVTRKLGCGFLFAFYSNNGRICSRLWAILRHSMWPWKLGQVSFKVT